MTISLEPDETAHYEPSHQDLHGLQSMSWSVGLKWLKQLLQTKYCLLKRIHINNGIVNK